jgi:hypothetical protein
MLRFIFLILAFLCVSASLRAKAQQGGNWIEEDYSPAAQASERIPPACVLGVVNTRFQWMPGPMDVVVHYWEKYRGRIVPWLENRALPFLRKYVPILVQWEQNIQKARNAVIIATPVVLKILKKF